MAETGDLPIDIDLPNLELYEARAVLPLHFAPANLPRIRSIRVGFAAYGAPALLASLLHGNLPKLQTLEVCCRNPEHYEIEWTDEEEEQLHPATPVRTLEIQQAPILTRVVLWNCLLPWNADIYSQLTYLEIRVNDQETFVDEQDRPTHNQLLSIITSMAAIEELYLDIFPEYANVAVVPPLIQVPPGCQRVTLHSPEPFLNRHCYKLAASLVVPPQAKFIIKQASGQDAGLILNHFAGPLRPPRALSLRTGLDSSDEPSIGEVIIPFDPNLWLNAPANLLTTTPAGCISVQFYFHAVTEPSDEARCYNRMFEALSRISFGELRVLRIEGLEEEHIGRLMSGGGNMLSGAANLEVLVASLDYARGRLLDAMVPGQPPFPQLHTIHQH